MTDPRKMHFCSLCTGPIHPGRIYLRETLVYDGRVYDWLTCPACSADGILMLAFDWAGGYLDEGVTAEVAHEWATEAVVHGTPEEQRAAKNFLERAASHDYMPDFSGHPASGVEAQL